LKATVGVAAIGVPVGVITAGLGLAGIAGVAIVGLDIGNNVDVGNWGAVAYDVGTILGGAAVGGAAGRAVAEGVNGVPSPPWSIPSDWAQGYDPNLGSIARLESLSEADADEARQLEGTFKMLANATRLRLLHALVCKPEMCVTDLAQAIGMKPQAVSNQLQCLVERGILGARRNGRTR